MACEYIAELELNIMVRNAIYITMIGDGAMCTVDGYSVVNDTIGKDIPLCSSGD